MEWARPTPAGYLVALIVFPVLFAGLGAWGGGYPAPTAPGSGPAAGAAEAAEAVRAIRGHRPRTAVSRQRDDDLPAILRGGYLKELPRPFPASPRCPGTGHRPAAGRPALRTRAAPGRWRSWASSPVACTPSSAQLPRWVTQRTNACRG